jgi:hypothetical protein
MSYEMVARGGIEPPTRGFSVTNSGMQHQLHQPVSPGARCNGCFTMQDRAELIHAKLPQKAAVSQTFLGVQDQIGGMHFATHTRDLVVPAVPTWRAIMTLRNFW